MSARARAAVVLLGLLAGLGAGCKEKREPAVGASASAPASAAPAAPSAATDDGGTPAVSEAQGRSLMEQNCLSCHTEDLLAQQRLTAAQWAKVVKKMHGWGAPLDPGEVDPLIAYLSARYSPAAPPVAPPAISPGDAAGALAPLPDGPFAKGDAGPGLALHHERCAPCHAEDGRGAAVGVNLVDRPLLYRATEFARAVRTGRGKMPGFPDTSDREVADLLAHLRRLRRE